MFQECMAGKQNGTHPMEKKQILNIAPERLAYHRRTIYEAFPCISTTDYVVLTG